MSSSLKIQLETPLGKHNVNTMMRDNCERKRLIAVLIEEVMDLQLIGFSFGGKKPILFVVLLSCKGNMEQLRDEIIKVSIKENN